MELPGIGSHDKLAKTTSTHARLTENAILKQRDGQAARARMEGSLGPAGALPFYRSRQHCCHSKLYSGLHDLMLAHLRRTYCLLPHCMSGVHCERGICTDLVSLCTQNAHCWHPALTSLHTEVSTCSTLPLQPQLLGMQGRVFSYKAPTFTQHSPRVGGTDHGML